MEKRDARAEVEDLLRQGEQQSPAPAHLQTRRTSAVDGDVFYLNEGTSSNTTVFYLHGGAYVHGFSQPCWQYIASIVERTEALVIAPAYRLVPFGTWEDAFSLVTRTYSQHLQDNPGRKVVLMGDSAGGGLALALAEHFGETGIKLPDELILLSPWVDISMENDEIAAYESKDTFLSVPQLSVFAQHWAGGLDLHDWRVSPIFGKLKDLSNVTVFVGTHEVFYPDVTRFFGMLDNNGTNELIVGEGMPHEYPLLPIPEAKAANEKIYRTITR